MKSPSLLDIKRLAAKDGMRAIILDDDWQTDDNSRGALAQKCGINLQTAAD